MTEAEWLFCTDPESMLEFLRTSARGSGRKLCLLAGSCLRSVWHMLPAEGRHCAEFAEQRADKITAEGEMPNTCRAVRSLARTARNCYLLTPGQPDRSGIANETKLQVALLRDVFGNPFRPLPVLAASLLDWHGSAAIRFAQAIYEERSLPSGHLDAARLAVLADMLEDGGCCDAGLLGHLRGPGPHVRGCFGVDLLLGKS